jgi:flagellar hook-basal body complex protein FliE
MIINPISAALPVIAPVSPGSTDKAGAFQSVLSQAIETVEGQHQSAEQSINRLLSGEGEELHRTAMATQQAEMSFNLFMQVRNKVVQAYQEVMRMQL